MKKTIIALVLFATTFSLQAQDTITVRKDLMNDQFYAYAPRSILCLDKEGKQGFRIWMGVEYKKDKAAYAGLIVKSVNIGSCVENDELIILFTDGTKYTPYKSWNKFNCDGDSYFDLYHKDMDKLNNKIKAIRFTNGRTSESYTHIVPEEDADAFMVNIEAIINNRVKFENEK